MDDGLEQVILVDADDNRTGTAPKLEAHRIGLRHRALSVIVRDASGRLLLQKRQARKYHSGGLWTNTCCSHPRPQEPVQLAAARRLREEMGIACPLLHLMTVAYRAEVGAGMIEDEIVHVFAGLFEGPVRPDPGEADGFAWIGPEALRADISTSPERYSVWFRKYCAEHWPQLVGGPCWQELARAG
jgi:isopentenyl-diphosphate delta-isomerase